MPKAAQHMDRREFLAAAATAAGGLAIGFSFAGGIEAKETGPGTAFPWDTPLAAGAKEVNAWVVVEPDGAIILRLTKSEMGQGIYTTVPMILAEELECDWRNVKVEYASANRNMREKNVYGDMSTHGSATVRTIRVPLQQVAASARVRLVAAAAHRWNVDPSSCVAESGRVHHKATRRSLSYGEVAGEAASISLDQEPAIKSGPFKIMGNSLPRLETRSKVIGAAQYGIDVRVPDMVYAAVRMAPVFGAGVASYDEAAVVKRRGIIAVVPLPDGVAVVADSFWRAKQAAADLPITWKPSPADETNTKQFSLDYVAAAMEGPMSLAHDSGGADAILAAGTTLDAVYEVPNLAHAAMEPLNCTAYVQADRVDVWVGTQFPENCLRQAARVSGLKPEQAFVHNCFLGGGFGRRMLNDEVPQAVAISKAVGKPVKLVWTRENDMRQGRHRPQSAVRIRAALGEDGLPKAVAARSAVGSLLVSTGFGGLRNGLEPWICDGLVAWPYDNTPALKVEGLAKNTHVPVMWWRSTSSSIHIFVVETYMDELAHAAKVDPYQYRRGLLQSKPANLAVLDEAARRGHWGDPLPAGSGRGIAFFDGLGSTVAQVAEVTVGKDGAVTVDRLVLAYDLGNVVHPDLVRRQLEGGIIFGLAAALYGEITIKDGQVVQGNFDDYRMVRMGDCPPIECYPMLSGGSKWGGVGEVGVPAVAPAIGNAIFAATGKRVRSLPFKSANLV